MVRSRSVEREIIMSVYAVKLQHQAVALVGAFVFAALMISAAAPVLPVA